MITEKCTFALYFGNRGFFPGALIARAREEVAAALKKMGHPTLALDAGATRHGAVETLEEAGQYARFLAEHKGQFSGIILCLPNFGDENGAVAALRDAGVPILIQAYPDDLDALDPKQRRDAFCGKFSIMDVFCQNGIPFTALKPHVVRPSSDAFAQNIDYFGRLCRVVQGMKRFTIGAIGARTTAFKTVRIDELALQHHGITVETLDMSTVFVRIKELKDTAAVQAKIARLRGYTKWDGVPAHALEMIARLGVVLDQLVDELKLDGLAIRCWLEMQQQLGISPCTIVSELNDRVIAAACEVDIGSAIAMRALSLASGTVAACLDWNNNYGDAEDKCILFHCGPVPQQMMTDKGQVTDHTILENATGPGCGWGCNTGRIKPAPMTFSSVLTDAGKLRFYIGQGEITADPIPPEFFGCAGVAKIKDLENVLQVIGQGGYRHHVSVTPGAVAAPMHEAFTKYLGYEITPI